MHRQSTGFALGVGLAVVVGLLLTLRETPVTEHAGQLWSSVAGGPEPILVVVVGNRAALHSVLLRVDGKRLVAASEEAFALSDRRLVAASLEAVGPVLMLAGWRDEPLEIIAPRWEQPARSPEPDSVARLLDKPRLTLLESRALLGQI